jgi:hypothetical protein
VKGLILLVVPPVHHVFLSYFTLFSLFMQVYSSIYKGIDNKEKHIKQHQIKFIRPLIRPLKNFWNIFGLWQTQNLSLKNQSQKKRL